MKLTTLLSFYMLYTQYSMCSITLDCALGYLGCEECAMDGAWTMWSVWGGCEGDCGGVGYKLRSRNCSNPPPYNNGALCAGDQRQVKPCRTQACTLEKYEQILAQDKVRRQQLQVLRDSAGSQTSLLAQCLSSHCSMRDISRFLPEPTTATKFWNSLQCVKENTGCPVPGGWCPWSEWSRCSAQCGSGRQVRCRVCSNPPPSSSYLSCAGDPCEFQDCNGSNCVRGSQQGVWSEWTEWSKCNSPCNLGISRRSRTCKKPRQSNKRKIPSYDSSDLDGNDDYYDDDYYDYAYYSGEPLNSVYDHKSAEIADDNDGSWYFGNRKPNRKRQVNNENYYADNDGYFSYSSTFKSVEPKSIASSGNMGYYEDGVNVHHAIDDTFKTLHIDTVEKSSPFISSFSKLKNNLMFQKNELNGNEINARNVDDIGKIMDTTFNMVIRSSASESQTDENTSHSETTLNEPILGADIKPNQNSLQDVNKFNPHKTTSQTILTSTGPTSFLPINPVLPFIRFNTQEELEKKEKTKEERISEECVLELYKGSHLNQNRQGNKNIENKIGNNKMRLHSTSKSSTTYTTDNINIFKIKLQSAPVTPKTKILEIECNTIKPEHELNVRKTQKSINIKNEKELNMDSTEITTKSNLGTEKTKIIETTKGTEQTPKITEEVEDETVYPDVELNDENKQETKKFNTDKELTTDVTKEPTKFNVSLQRKKLTVNSKSIDYVSLPKTTAEIEDCPDVELYDENTQENNKLKTDRKLTTYVTKEQIIPSTSLQRIKVTDHSKSTDRLGSSKTTETVKDDMIYPDVELDNENIQENKELETNTELTNCVTKKLIKTNVNSPRIEGMEDSKSSDWVSSPKTTEEVEDDTVYTDVEQDSEKTQEIKKLKTDKKLTTCVTKKPTKLNASRLRNEETEDSKSTDWASTPKTTGVVDDSIPFPKTEITQEKKNVKSKTKQTDVIIKTTKSNLGSQTTKITENCLYTLKHSKCTDWLPPPKTTEEVECNITIKPVVEFKLDYETTENIDRKANKSKNSKTKQKLTTDIAVKYTKPNLDYKRSKITKNCFYRVKSSKWSPPPTTTGEVECNTEKPEEELELDDEITENTLEPLKKIDQQTKENKDLKTEMEKPTAFTEKTENDLKSQITNKKIKATEMSVSYALEQEAATTTKGISKSILELSTQESSKHFGEITTLETLLSTIAESEPIESGDQNQLNFTEKQHIADTCDLKAVFALPNQNSSFETNDCSGAFEEIKPCNIRSCHADGGWSRWSAWSPCSADCGVGYQESTRSCTNPEPRNEGDTCVGDATWKRSCFLLPCAEKVVTSRAMLMNGDSLVKYSALHQQWALLMVYVRLRPFSSFGHLISRKSERCHQTNNCDLVQLSLYDGYLLLQVMEEGCHAEILSDQQLSIGDWHEILLTIVGTRITLRLDDSVFPQGVELSCRPSYPAYDSPMTIGSRYIGEVDSLTVNLKKFALLKKKSKRDAAMVNMETIEPEESYQVQHEVSTVESFTVSLATLLQAPCFINESEWKVVLAVQPQFTIGLVLFVRGRDKNEWLAVTLEHSRVRLRLRLASGLGGCDQPANIDPFTWLHLAITKPAGGPVGLAVNGAPRCVTSFYGTANDSEDQSIKCTDSIYLGEMPAWVKSLLRDDGTQSPPILSPLGQLGSLSVDNHTLDLSQLPRRLPPDLTHAHTISYYRYSSLTASTSAYYEEMMVQMGEPFSLTCMYDLSKGGRVSQENVYSRDRDTSEYSASWMMVDLPVELAFENNSSNVQYLIWDNGKTITLNVTGFSSTDAVEGFYSCWLHYPLPHQPGLNIITYGVVVVQTDRDVHDILGPLLYYDLLIISILLVLLVLWLITEIILDLLKRSGFYRCGMLNDEEVRVKVQQMIFSKKGVEMLGGTEAALRSYSRFLEYLEQKDKEQTEETTMIGEFTDDETNIDDETVLVRNLSGPVSSVPKEVVDKANRKESKFYSPRSSPEEDNLNSPKVSVKPQKRGLLGLRAGSDYPSRLYPWMKGNFADGSSVDNYLASDDVLYAKPAQSDGTVEDNLIIVSENWKKKEFENVQTETNPQSKIGVIQKTSAYRHIENELKFIPDKFKQLEKCHYSTNRK